eukprot:gene477-257_t
MDSLPLPHQLTDAESRETSIEREGDRGRERSSLVANLNHLYRGSVHRRMGSPSASADDIIAPLAMILSTTLLFLSSSFLMALRVRTELLDSLRVLHANEMKDEATSPEEDGSPTAASTTAATSSSTRAGAAFTAQDFVERCPFLADESWAMEEFLRVSSGYDVGQWYGTQLPKEVWAPPGTAHCRFHTQEVNFAGMSKK